MTLRPGAGSDWDQGWVPVDGGRLAYTFVPGPGPGPHPRRPALLLHGWAASRRLWWPLMGLAARDGACMAVDMPGFGESPPIPGAEAPEALGRLAAQAARGLGLDRGGVVGHSLGAMVALELALQGSEMASRVVIVGPPERGALRRRSRLLARNLTGWPVAVALAATAHLAVPIAPASGWGRLGVWLRRRAAGAGTSPAVLLTSIRRLAAAEVYDRLEDVPVPVLVVVGARDVSTPPHQAAAVAQRIPRAEVVVIPGAGHHVMTDAPRALARLVSQWLAEP